MNISTLKDKIHQISNQFIQEATNSPTLMADMASMEKYMAESYSERIFIELLQNADDCGSTKVIVKQIENDLYFANDGRPFNEDDIVAICRSGASSKQRGTNIGYRGIGFKSSTYLSDEILIYSGGDCFTFSKRYCAKLLNVPESEVPTVRIPFCVDTFDDNYSKVIHNFTNQGYRTVFLFRNVKWQSFERELKYVEPDYFIFLNNVLKCDISTNYHAKSLDFKRILYEYGYDFFVNSDNINYWRILKGNKSSIAFKVKNGEITECEAKEATYHSYLPTIDKTPYKIKINSDFSTDPSRKHLTIDNFTETALQHAAEQIYDVFQTIFLGNELENASQLFLIFSEQTAFSSINSIFTSHLKVMLKKLNLRLSSGEHIAIADYKLLPSWLSEAERNIIRKYSPLVRSVSLPCNIYEKYIAVDAFISSYSDTFFSINDMIEILSEKILVDRLSHETQGTLIANIIKKAKIKNQINGDAFDIKKLIMPMVEETERPKADHLRDVIESLLSKSDFNWVKAVSGIELIQSEQAEAPVAVKETLIQSKVPTVTKWRSAEQQVIQIEEFIGNKAIDVSKKNLGYDIESTTTAGTKRYIEVKSLQNDYSGFCITNNEYTAAHQLGEEYYICLIFENRVIYIQNPLENLSFEKRIRQWEWLCEEYSGQEIKINAK